MTDEEIQRFIEWCGSDMPHPDHEPRRMAYYVRLWRHYEGLSCKPV
jgi:hypothetical protein